MMRNSATGAILQPTTGRTASLLGGKASRTGAPQHRNQNQRSISNHHGTATPASTDRGARVWAHNAWR